jgi:hypothetical protein
MTSACAPAFSLLADDVAVAAAGETTWLDRTAPVVVAGVDPGTGDVTPEATVETSEATTGVLVGEESAGAGGVVPTTEVVDVPRVGKFGF